MGVINLAVLWERKNTIPTITQFPIPTITQFPTSIYKPV